MASILRSGKFLRYFAGFTRNVVVNTVRDSDGGGSLLQSTSCMCQQFQHGFVNGAVPKSDLSLEKQLRRLDQDVRRAGRISRRDIEEVLEEIRIQQSATSSQSLLVIRCCGNLVPEEPPEVRTALVHEIWKTLKTLNIPMDISHYNALLRVYLENEHPFSPTEFLSEIEASSIEPNRVTYQRLIARYCQQGDIDGATRILEYMREKKLPVNENVFNSLILGHSQANDMESAKGILTVMKQAGLEPTADTYSTLLCSYARRGDIESILTTLDECEKNEILLLDKDILDIVYDLTVNGYGDKIEIVLKKLHFSTGFNQDAVNIILRLVNKGYEDESLRILRLMPRGTRPDGQVTDAGSFLIKQLVKANRPVEKILNICKILEEEGLHSRPLLIATEAGLINGIVNNALPLLKEMKNAGLPIRQHYFWPLFCSAESSQVIGIVRQMQQEFALNPNAETVREYVIPNMNEKNWDKIVLLLRDAGVSNSIAVSSAAYAAISANQLAEASKIMESSRAYFNPYVFKSNLIQALSKTQDYPAFVRVVRQIYESVQNRNTDQKPDQDANEAESELAETDGAQFQDVVGPILRDVSAYFRRDSVAHLEQILPLLVEQGLPISNRNATRISERLGTAMTPAISEYLGVLSSGELETVPFKSDAPRKRSIETLTVEELERFIVNVDARGESSKNIKRYLLAACFRSRNLPKVLEVIERLKAEDFKLTSGNKAQLIDLYTYHSQLSDALALFHDLKTKEPEFVLDNLKTLRIVNLLVKEERLDEAVKFLEINKKPELIVEGESTFNYVTTVWRILNALAETGDALKLQQIFDALLKCNYMHPTNVLLGPLIKVQLVRDDVQKAMEVFEHLCTTYKATPWKNELACRLIQKEDAANLQKLTDLSTNIHGEINSLYDLVFSFVECGRVRQARKILETPGLRIRSHRIDNACERYQSEGLVEPLEGLIEATKDLNHIDRNKIYYNLLLSYCKSEDTAKALGLWTKMQEEDITPSDVFLLKLADLLKSKNEKIPFVIPQNVQEQTIVTPGPISKAKQTTPPNPSKERSNLSLYRKAIHQGAVDDAINYKNNFSRNESVSATELSHLIELLVRADRISEATKYVLELLDSQQFPKVKIFKFYLNKLAAVGDIDTMEKIAAKSSDEQKKLLSFDNRICNANIVAGKAEQYLDRLYEEISAIKSSDEAATLVEKFPRGGALGILDKHPECLPKYQKLAEAYAKHNQLGPMNVLWMHLISNGNEEASKAIWQQYLSNAPRLMFQRVLQTAREQKDHKLAESVIAQLRQSKISEGAIGNAYSCLIDILTNNKDIDKALATLNTAVKDVCLENINRSALTRLKTALESEKKNFPYVIPEAKKSKDIDSSSANTSSSDDEVKSRPPETQSLKPKVPTK